MQTQKPQRVIQCLLLVVILINAEGCSFLANPTVTLHAKLVDQHGAPAPNVRIQGNVAIAPLIQVPMVGPGTESFQTKTDPEGRITLSYRAYSIWLTKFENPNYLFGHWGYKDFSNSQFHLPSTVTWPTGEMSADNPVIIPVWKREGAVALNVGGKTLYTPQNQVERILIKNTPMELEISWNTPGTDQSPGAWTLRIRVINGEIQATDDVFPFEAPTGGYRAEWVGGGIDSPSAAIRNLRKKFYVKDRDNKFYGRLTTYINPYFRDKNELEIGYWINHSGERGLLNNTTSGD